MTDLATLDVAAPADEGARMELTHPVHGTPLMQADGKTPITITLLGKDSKRWRKFVHATANKRLGSRKVKQTAEEIEAENTAGWVALTVGWSGIVLDGQTLDFSPENARMLYTRMAWVREQVAEFVDDRANFLRE